MPVLGVPLFWYTKSDVGHNALKRRLLDLEGQTRAQLPQNEQTVELLQEQAPEAMPLARYLRGKGGGFPVYADTVATYFNGGEAMFDEMLRQLETAEEYIFVEYFIIDEGLMWGKILEVLARKALQGVDVRVMYDGTCEFSTLPRNYPRLLEKLRRLAEKYPDQIVKKDRQTFLVPKRCVSVREPYSAERRKAASELAKAAGYRPPTPKKGNE